MDCAACTGGPLLSKTTRAKCIEAPQSNATCADTSARHFCPAGQTGSFRTMSEQREIRVREHQPLLPGTLEVDLHACMRAAAFVVDDDAFAERRVTHALTE